MTLFATRKKHAGGMEDVRHALLDGERSGEPGVFDFEAFTRRKRTQHGG